MPYPSVTTSATLADATGLQIKAWDRILAMRAMPEDIFFALGGNYSQVLKAIPQGFFMKVPAAANQAYSVTFPLLMPLSSDPGMGTGTDILTNAEQQSLRQFIAYYNDYDKSVKSTGFGIEYIQGVPFGLMEKITPAIALFLKEMFGYWMRYAIINGISPNLQATPVSQSITPHPLTFIKGLTEAQQPAARYTNNNALMASIIAAEMLNCPAGTNGALNVKTILAVANYLTYNKPCFMNTVGGDDVFIMTVPTSQKAYLLNPANADGLGVIWSNTSRFANKAIADLPLALGQVQNVVLVEDPRAPVAKAYGSGSGSSAASATNAVYVDQYLKPGLNDARTSLGTTDIMEACFILGKGGIADLEPEAPHYENETQNLGKVVIKAACGSRGFNRMDYEKSTPTATSKINQSSAVLWCRKQVGGF